MEIQEMIVYTNEHEYKIIANLHEYFNTNCPNIKESLIETNITMCLINLLRFEIL